jgi:hypothetical protein
MCNLQMLFCIFFCLHFGVLVFFLQSCNARWFSQMFWLVCVCFCSYGFDPFGLSKKPSDFDKYQAYELIHGRWAMLGAAGFVLPEAFNRSGAICGPEAVWFKTGALLLDGNTLSYFGANIPVNLAAAVIAEVLLVGGAEYYRSTNKSPLGSVMPFSKTFFPQY